MQIVPDIKDWTWVLTRSCPECGFDAAAFPRESAGALIRDNAERWQPVLTRGDVRQRPREDVWSPLEYACHVRDVYRLFDQRLVLMLAEDDPEFVNWDQDETAVAERYGEQDPAQVARDLAAAATALADRFDTVAGEQWERPGRRSNGSLFTVESLARYLIHDPVHHLHDVAG